MYQDTRRFIEKYKSGFVPPAEVPFEDLSDCSNTTPQNIQTPPTKRPDRTISKGTVSGGKDKKKRGGLFAIFSGPKVTNHRRRNG